ncbi:MAG: NADH-quinone oxidoreductase [Thermoproteus sp.]|jgi:NADH-quinone oxidoreductase subunit J|nr:NADH-quinone oxidoreductase [Thermoproteus sp.]
MFLEYLVLAVALIFGVLAVLVKDNAVAALSLAFSAATVAAYYALAGLMAASFLVFVVYIGSVILMVIVTASMYGGFFDYPRRYKAAVAVLAVVAALLLWALIPQAPPPQVGQELQPNFDLLALIAALLVSSLVVAIEVAKRV